MSRIVVCPAADLTQVEREERPGAVVSMLSDAADHPSLTGVEIDTHLRLTFHDVVPQTVLTPAIVPPAPHQVEALIDLARRWDGARPLVLHCRFGVSRSPAAAVIAVCARDPTASPREVARLVRERAPFATPNARMIAIADDLLGFGGELTAAVEAIGRGSECSSGTPFAIEAR